MVSPQPRSEPQPDAFLIPPPRSWQVNRFVLSVSTAERTVVVQLRVVVPGPVLAPSEDAHRDRHVTPAPLDPPSRPHRLADGDQDLA